MRAEKMSSVSDEAAALLRQVAEPRPVGDSVKAAIGRAARRLGFSWRRTKTIWYGETSRIGAEEMDALRRATQRKHAETVARAEAIVAVDRLVALRAALASSDEDFHRETLAQIDDTLRALGRDVGTVALFEDKPP